jgi:TonB-dependent starch-binding outer membrane protein SusC
MRKKTRVLFVLFSLAYPILTFGQEKTISGTVIDEAKEAIPGVTVLIKGTQQGTITNMDGYYTLQISDEANSLIFSSVGFETKEVEIGNRTEINVEMKSDILGLNEVIVVGYGVQKKKLITGATSQVSGEDLQKLNTVSPVTALQSQTAGINITKESGEPGSGFKVNIRGIGTIGNSEPLYIVDGVPRSIEYINPADIESLDILKDAASAAIYGSRAANGVVLVTTRQGKKGQATISYDAYYGVQNLYKKLPLLNAQEYAAIMNEANVNSGLRPYNFESLLAPGDWERIQNGTWNGTNWLDAMENANAPIQNHSLNIAGGSDKSTYSIGASYTAQEGILGNPVASDYERYTLRVNSDHVIASNDEMEILTVGEKISYSYSEKSGIATGNMYWNDINAAIKTDPFLPLYERDEEGNPIPGQYHESIAWNTLAVNPTGKMVYSRGYNRSKDNNLNATLYAKLQPIKGLNLRSSFSFSQSGWTYRSYTPVHYLGPNSQETEDQTRQQMGMGNSWMFENTLSYSFQILNRHQFDLLAGTSAERGGLGQELSATNKNNQFDEFKYAYIDNANNTQDGKASIGGKPWEKSGLLSYFGRISYDFDETYLATIVMRADGSSNFAPGYRWGYFPSISAGWVISNESFMTPLSSAIGFLKLRASWGQNGNQSIPGFQYLSLITFNSSENPANYYFDPEKSNPSIGAYPGNLPTEDLTWETSEQLDIGLDAYVLNNKLNIAFDWYKKDTKDWLLPAPILASWGVNTAPYINGGDISNQGVELALTWRDRIGEFQYSVNANLSHNENEVTRIDNTQGLIEASDVKLWGNGPSIARAEVGFPVGYFWGYETAGLFQNMADVNNYTNSEGVVIMPNAQPGDVIFVDKNGDGTINDDDKVMIGDPNPDYIFSFNLGANYKGFDISVATYGVLGNQIARSWHDAGSPLNNYTTEILDRWTGEGTSNKIPRVQNGSSINQQYTSDLNIEDGDYWRISNLTLGYDFKNIMPDSPLSQIRLYVTAQNLYTFTSYSGMDPEIGTSTDDEDYGWVKGVDLGFYPSPRTFMAGVSLKF